MVAERGTRDKLEKYFDLNSPLKVTLTVEGAATYDYCCFGVDKDDKLSDDRYMIFYNQPTSPAGEIVGAEIPSGMAFTLKINNLPPTIQKLVFTASIDGAGTMGEISRYKISVGDKISAQFDGTDFAGEKAITSLEIYRKGGVWRFNVVARGFNGGLDALLAFYGGEISDDEKPAPSQPQKISLEKKIRDGAPKLISLSSTLLPALRLYWTFPAQCIKVIRTAQFRKSSTRFCPWRCNSTTTANLIFGFMAHIANVVLLSICATMNKLFRPIGKICVIQSAVATTNPSSCAKL